MDMFEDAMSETFPDSQPPSDSAFLSDSEESQVQNMEVDPTTSLCREPISKRRKTGKVLTEDMTGKPQRPSIAKRRNFNFVLELSPTETNEGEIPPTPQAPSRPKRKAASKYNTRSIKTSAAKVLFQDEMLANPEHSKELSCRGRLFMASPQSQDADVKTERLFFNLGQNLYLDKQPDKTGVGEGSLRLSLWKTNSIDKLQRVGARFSITLNFDALRQIKQEAEDIKVSLSLSDNESFLGYCMSLGQGKFLTVDPDICSVNLRKWFKPAHKKNDPEGDLLPSKEGIRLSYEQFKRFAEFLETQLTTEFPTFESHVFCCDKPDHVESECSLCHPQGLLPMQREFQRLLGDCVLKMFQFMVVILVGFAFISRVENLSCGSHEKCQCLARYISCRGVISLPDVLDSRLFPLRESPPVTADLRGNALTQATLTRFLLVFPSIKRVILTDQLESVCPFIPRLHHLFPRVVLETDCLDITTESSEFKESTETGLTSTHTSSTVFQSSTYEVVVDDDKDKSLPYPTAEPDVRHFETTTNDNSISLSISMTSATTIVTQAIDRMGVGYSNKGNGNGAGGGGDIVGSGSTIGGRQSGSDIVTPLVSGISSVVLFIIIIGMGCYLRKWVANPLAWRTVGDPGLLSGHPIQGKPPRPPRPPAPTASSYSRWQRKKKGKKRSLLYRILFWSILWQ